MSLFDKEAYNRALQAYYDEHYGAREEDVWYDQPAVNVWVFGRDGTIVTLKSHILNYEVEAKEEPLLG